MKRKVLALGLVLLAAATAVVLGRILLKERAKAPRLYGNIEAVEVPVGFRVSGRLLERAVDEGERVRKGQVLARLEGRDLEAVLGEREAQVSAARAALAELERGFRPQEVEQARQALEAASAEADRWRADLVRQRALFQREVISRRELEAAESAGRASEARKREAEERYRLLAAGARREQIEAGPARPPRAAPAGRRGTPRPGTPSGACTSIPAGRTSSA
jgi:HlyD family secretion protein